MKKTFFLDTVRNIRKRLVSWLSISIIIFIGISGILGINSTAYSIERCVDGYYKEHNFKDYDITSNLGIKESEIEKFKSLAYIADAEGMISIAGKISFAGESSDATLLTKTSIISVPYATEGRLPQADNEVAIGKELAESIGASIGDTVSISPNSSRLSGILKNQEYVVTGYAYHPDFVYDSVLNNCIFSIDAFDTSGLSFDYTNVVLDSDVPHSAGSLSSAYVNNVRSHMDDLNAATDEMSADRIESFSRELDDEYAAKEKEAEDKLSEARTELDKAQKEYDEQVKEAEDKLEDGRTALIDAKKTVDSELAKAWKEITDGEAEYNRQVAEGEKQLADGKKQLEDELANGKWKLFAGFLELDNAEKTLNEKEAQYKAAEDRIAGLYEEARNGRDKLDKAWGEFNSQTASIDNEISNDRIDMVAALMIDDSLKAKFLNLKNYSGYDRGVQVLNLYESDATVRTTVDAYPELGSKIPLIRNMIAAKSSLDAAESEYGSKVGELDSAKAQLDAARKELDQGWFTLEQGKRQLADAQAEYDRKEPEARAELASKEAEFEKQKAEGADKIKKAKGTYASNKAKAQEELTSREKEFDEAVAEFEEKKKDGEEQLSQARKEYADAKAEIAKALSDARKEIEEAKKIGLKWIVQTREANPGFLHIKTTQGVLANFFLYFTPLYVIIVSLVVFFTMTIIVEEQKLEIGVVKAFGMYASEIIRKYLTFGITSAILGVIMGITGAYLIENLFLHTIRGNYIFGSFPALLSAIPTALLAIGSVLLTAIVVRRACAKMLSCSAVGLMNGTEPPIKSINKSRNKVGSSIYFSLIINNILTDLGRVIVSVIIILASCLMIGLGFTTRNALYMAIDKQLDDVWHFDLFAVTKGDITDEESQEISEFLENYRYDELYSFEGLAELDYQQTPLNVLVVDSLDDISERYTVADDKGKELSLSDDGILVTREMLEKNGYTPGTEIKLVNSSFDVANVRVSDIFIQYFEKTMIMSRKYYEQMYGKSPENNTFIISAGGRDVNAMEKELQSLSGIEKVTIASAIKENYASILTLFNLLVIVIIALAILLAFMILLNLSNILVLHRMRELLTMRVNGFSNSQVIGYLARETIATAALGLILGVVAGVPFSAFLITKLEATAVMFYRLPFPPAWIIALAISAFFSVSINAIAFRKVGKVPLTDISKY
ncbi:ABC transporter permease [Butyrivibrio proteoclasticus]|nr:FtsX-like permease family protein [Butyrivibrio proteoclasticus]